MFRIIRRAAAASLPAALGLIFGAAAAHAQTMGIGTMPQGSLSYATGAAVAKVMSENLGLSARVQPNSGESVLLPLINSGELDFGVANLMEGTEAYHGTGPFQGRPQKNLRALGVLFPLRVGYFVRKDSGIKSIADLKGKRVTWGYSAMGSIHPVLSALLANGGLTEADIRPVPVPNVVRGADDFGGGKADAFFFGLQAAKVTELDATVGGVMILPLSNDPKRIAEMKKVFPAGYLDEVKPRPGLTGVSGATWTLAYDNMLFAGAHVTVVAAAKVAAGLVENKEALARINPQFNGFDKTRMVKKLELPYHEGVLQWYRQAGLAPAGQ
jgi:TRAP transporter TAXI family solute receptor